MTFEVGDIDKENMFGHHATQRNTHCSFMSGCMNERRFLILLKNRGLTNFHIIRSFLLHELYVHYQRCLKSQKIKKRLKIMVQTFPFDFS